MTNCASTTVKIVNRLGLHARPAMAFVETAGRFKSSVSVTRDDQTVDGKSIMQVMMLAATRGALLEITAEGADAPQAVEAIERLVRSGFDED